MSVDDPVVLAATTPPAARAAWPRQRRSREALERLLAAGEALLADGRFDAAPVVEIATLASTSIGSFYRLVGDREQLLIAIHERFLVAGRIELEARLDPTKLSEAGPAVVVHTAVEVVTDIYAKNVGILRALIVRSSADTEFRERVHRLNDSVIRRMVTLLEPHIDHIDHVDPIAAIEFGTSAMLGTLNQRTFAGVDDLAVLIDELTRLIVRYLGLETGH